MRKLLMSIVVTPVVIMLFMGAVTFAAGGAADGLLNLTIPYVTVGETRYRGIFQFVSIPEDPEGLYWKLAWAGLTNLGEGEGGVLDASWNIHDVVVMFQGYQYLLDFQYTPIEHDPSGHYWKLIKAELLPVRISQVRGAGADCFDFQQLTPAQIQQVIQCLQGCGTDAQCYYECLGSVPGLGMFYLAMTFENLADVDFSFKIPPGTVFFPENSDVQPMMVLHEDPIVVPPGAHTVCMPVYCISPSNEAPIETDVFSQGGIINNACIYEVIERTYGKTLSIADEVKIQDIIWDCIEEGTMSEENRNYLASLQ